MEDTRIGRGVDVRYEPQRAPDVASEYYDAIKDYDDNKEEYMEERCKTRFFRATSGES